MTKSRRRPTIGLLYSTPLYRGLRLSPYPTAILEGARAAARDLDCDLLVSCGASKAAWPEPGETADFSPVGPWNTDGLLIVAPLDTAQKNEYVHKLSSSGFPVVFIAMPNDRYPTVCVDNETGIRLILNHLIHYHHHRKIAFIAGYEYDLGDSRIRLDTYCQFLSDSGIEVDPRLIAYGEHSEDNGYRAMKSILESEAEFSAVIGSNDNSAIGVMKALHEEGKKIPEDVAVVGFDNIIASLTATPPLATVQYSIFDLGYQGVNTLLDKLVSPARKSPRSGLPEEPLVVKIPCAFIPRQSCGCYPETSNAQQPFLGEDISAVESDHELPHSSKKKPSLEKRYRQLIDELTGVFLQASGNPNVHEVIRDKSIQLVTLIHNALDGGDLLSFRSELVDLISELDHTEQNLDHGQAAVNILRKHKDDFPADDTLKEDIFHLCRVMFSEGISRRMVRNILEWNEDLQHTGTITMQFLDARSEEQTLTTFFSNMGNIGIRQGYVLLYEPDETKQYQTSNLWSFQDSILKKQTIKTQQFPPRGILAKESPQILFIMPLLQHEGVTIGAVALETDHYRPLAMVIGSLAVSIHSSRLHEQVVNLSLTDDLTGVNNRRFFDLFVEKEVERCRRFNRPLALIFFDVDYMKRINDSYGHPCGDDVLRWVGEQTLKSVRHGVDIASRYGGDEFAVLLPETSAKSALVIAERIRKALGEKEIHGEKITASLGIAVVSGKEADAQSLIKWADVALYKAKERRDSICIFT
jgi:diguanylate cyclase (GGDEF)-like protein